MLSRRHFFANASALAITAWSLDLAIAAINNPGSGSSAPPVTLNNNRVTQNASIAYANIAKGFSFTAQDPTTVSSDGYPLTTPSIAIIANPSMPVNYYGSWVWKFTGQGSQQITSAPPMVLTSGGSFLVGSPTVDVAPGNTTILSQTNPKVVFAFGWNIQSIDNNGGLIRINTKTNFVNSGSGYTIAGETVNITGANANTGANGLWTITNKTASSFDLVGSTFTNAQAGVAGTAIFTANNLSWKFLNSGTFGSGATQMGGLVVCRTAEETSVDNGQIVDNTQVSQYQYLLNAGASLSSRAWLRCMDLSGVQSSFESDFALRTPTSQCNYSVSNFRSAYWTSGGSIANGGSDVYTCADPSNSVWNGSSYIDNAIVQGIPSATNSGGVPTLNVGGHGAKPIYIQNDGARPFTFAISAQPASAGLNMVWTFTASWLAGLPGVVGTTYTFTYTTVSGDVTNPVGSPGGINDHLSTQLVADTTLAAALIFAGNTTAGCVILPRTPWAGPLTLTYSSGPAICTVCTSVPSRIVSGSKGTFIYNYLLDGWIYRDGGLTCSVPFEAIVELCNRVGAHCWFNFGTTKGQFITDVTNFFGDATTGLTSGLRFGFEVYNEVWNSSASPFSLLQSFGNALGWTSSSFRSNFSYTALKTIQYSALSKAAWLGKGRSASDYYVFQQSQLGNMGVGSNFDTWQIKTSALSASNTIYSTYGGLNGSGAAPDYTASGSRGGDITTAVGCAPYWNSKWMGSGSFTTSANFNGTAIQNAPPLQAALDFANGLTSTAFTSMANQFSRTTVRSSGSTGGLDFVDMQGFFTSTEAMVSQYDAFRVGAGIPKMGVIHYEAGPSFGIGSNGNNGVNSPTFNTVASGDITSLASRMTTLDTGPGNFNVSPYTSSGTDNKTEMATMLLTMLQAWKYDVDRNGNAAGTGSYKGLIKTWYYQALVNTSGANRETKPCQFGTPASNWGTTPISIFDLIHYQNHDAMHEFNAGG